MLAGQRHPEISTRPRCRLLHPSHLPRQREPSLLPQPGSKSELTAAYSSHLTRLLWQAAFNAIENYEDAEIDCSRALEINKSHLKAYYRRAIARKGMGKYAEAEKGEHRPSSINAS